MVSLRFRVATDVIDQERVKGQKQVSNTLKACGGLLCDQVSGHEHWFWRAHTRT